MAAVLAPLLLTVGCATAPAGEGDGFPPRLGALGTEPFWSFTLERDAFAYTTPEAPQPRGATVARRIAQGALELEGSFAGQPLRARIRRDHCSDGMSDRSYPFAVTLTIEGRELAGCAYDADVPLPPA